MKLSFMHPSSNYWTLYSRLVYLQPINCLRLYIFEKTGALHGKEEH